MLEGKVVGHAIATTKHESLQGLKLLLVQPMLQDGNGPDGAPLLVVDCLGAGAHSRVMITSDGAFVKTDLGRENSPIRWTVMGLLDPRDESDNNSGSARPFPTPHSYARARKKP